MQSSLRPLTPRLVTISSNPSERSLSRNGIVRVESEISVTRSGLSQKPTAVSYNPTPPSSNSHKRGRGRERAKSPLNRWDSTSRMSERNQSTNDNLEPDSDDPDSWQRNRESMKALAEFLMTKEPPPTNWISIPSDDEISIRSLKKSTFKMFRRQKKQLPKSPKFLQLPDSAVAAKTRKGARHIAISIPMEFDHQDPLPAPQEKIARRTQTLPSYMDRPDRGAVTILKPVAEGRESISSTSPRSPVTQNLEKQLQRSLSVSTLPSDARETLGVDATLTLESYYAHMNRQHLQTKNEALKSEQGQGSRSYIAVSPSETIGQTNERRHSNGTLYSMTTLMSSPSHSREISGASSITPLQGLRLDLPPRKSSKSTIVPSLDAEISAEIARMASLDQTRRDISAPSPATGSVHSRTTASQSPATVSVAEMAMGYRSVTPQHFRTSTPQSPGHPPSKKLPELPHYLGRQTIHPLTAEAGKGRIGSNPSPQKQPEVRTEDVEAMPVPQQQSRQDKVKARKQRDIAASHLSSQRTPSPAQPTTNTLLPTTPNQQSEKQSQSQTQNPPHKRSTSTRTPIMIVANLTPYTCLVLESDLASPLPPPQQNHSPQNTTKQPTTSTPNSPKPTTHHPPHSSTSSLSTFPSPSRTPSLTLPQTFSASQLVPKASSTSLFSPTSHTNLHSTRHQRRQARNASLREKEVEARLTRIERDNALLISTLSDMAGSFGVLGALMGAERRREGGRVVLGVENGDVRGRERERERGGSVGAGSFRAESVGTGSVRGRERMWIQGKD